MDRGRIASRPLGFLIALALTALASLLLLPVRDALGLGGAALVFVVVVWLTAALGGVLPGLLASVASMVAIAYLLAPPYHELSVADSSDRLALVVFAVVGVLIGLLTGRLRERSVRALRGEAEAESLAALSTRLVSRSTPAEMGDEIAAALSRATGSPRVAVIVRTRSGALVEMSASPREDLLSDAGIERFAQWAIEQDTAVGLPPRGEETVDSPDARTLPWPRSEPHDAIVPGAQRGDVFIPLATPDGVQGVLYIGPLADRRPLCRREAELAVSLSHLAAAFLEHRRLQDHAMHADTVREGERLKATLVSSVSHELKTPLTAMTATVSGLLAPDATLDAERVRHDLQVVEEGLRRLSASIADLLDLSRLESDAWESRRETYEVGEIIGSLIGRIPESDRTRIALEVPPGLSSIEVDFVQLSRALSNLVENALDYSGPEGTVRIGADDGDGSVEVWVEDNGPGIAEEERSRVFDKFYRGSAASRVPSGTGLGLTIAQEIVEFNGGTLRLESAWPRGARFVVTMPAAALPEEERL